MANIWHHPTTKFGSQRKNGVSGKSFIVSKSRHWFVLVMAVNCLFEFSKQASGQEALRISIAGDLAAESQKQSESSIGYYNLLLGPMAWRFSSGLELDYNDNVRLQQQDPEGDFIFRPNLNAQMHWPITEVNSLDFSVGLGYSAYLRAQDLDQVYINPGSGLSFDIYVGDCKINLHDQINITENAYQNTGTGGNQSLVSLQNTAGASALWDLNKAIVTFGYDHVNYISLSQNQQQPDAASENLFANVGMRVRPELLIGLEAGGTLINYDQSNSSNSFAEPDAKQWNLGAFSSAQISDYMSVRLDAGYTAYLPDTSTNSVTSDASGLYFQFSLSHRVNQFLNYSVSAGRSTDLQSYGQPQTYYFARLQPNWNILNKYQISTPFSWQGGTQVYNSPADYDQYSLGLNVSRSLTQKLSGGLSYQFVKETSSQSSLNYTVNIVSLNFSYQF
jgi:hypothetical protein